MRTKAIASPDGTETVELTADENAQRDAEEAAWAAEAPARAAAEVQINRRSAYQSEADALFFEEQRGEVSGGTWAAKVDEIKLRFPK